MRLFNRQAFEVLGISEITRADVVWGRGRRDVHADGDQVIKSGGVPMMRIRQIAVAVIVMLWW